MFGAGASKASADLPLGKDLVWDFIPDIGDKPNNEKMFEKFLAAVIKYAPEYKGELKKFKSRKNILYNPPLFLKKNLYIDDLLRRAQESQDEMATKIIRDLIFEHLNQGHFCNGSGKLYNLFVKEILQKKHPENVSIINFNFDYLLSEFSHIIEQSVEFDYLLEFYNNKEYTKQPEERIIQIKPHGSLNWGICRKCRSLHYFFNTQPGFYLTKKCERCDSKLDPYIVIPYENKIIKILWDKAKELISEADKITIIGYSFPEYDIPIIELFKNAMQKDILIEIVDIPRDRECPSACKMRIMNQYNRMFSDPLLPNIESSRMPSDYSNTEIKTSGFGGYLADKLV